MWVTALGDKEDMKDILKDVKSTDYDKVIHHASKLQDYLKNLKLAVTRSKASAILGNSPPPQVNTNLISRDDIPEEEEENTIIMDDNADPMSLSPIPPPLHSTPVSRFQFDTPPYSGVFLKNRRTTTKSPSTSSSSTVVVKRKRSPKDRHSKSKFNARNLLQMFSPRLQPGIKRTIEQLEGIPELHWNDESGQVFLKNKELQGTSIAGLLHDLTYEDKQNLVFTPTGVYTKVTKELSKLNRI